MILGGWRVCASRSEETAPRDMLGRVDHRFVSAICLECTNYDAWALVAFSNPIIIM